MRQERRRYRRLDVSMIVEFKTFTGAATSYLGITRDFACEGFSFESQDFEGVPGENLEVKFKHSETNQYVSALGEIVWKEKSGEFGYLIGIRIREVYNATKRRMLEIISAIGHIPFDFFNDVIDEAELSDEEFLLSARKQTSEAIRGEENLLAGAGRTACYAASRSRRGRRMRRRSRIPLVLAGTLLLISFSATPISVNSHKLFKTHASIYDKTALHPAAAHTEPVHTINESQFRHSLYSVQVASWKNPEYADEILPQLQKKYPDAYVVVENGFHIIRIPGIVTREQGNGVVEEMKDRFNLISLLIQSR